MALFESMLILMLVAIALLQVSRHTSLPYPAMLALAGVVVAALPWSPTIAIDPHLALALFIAPALLDAGYDLPPRELRRNWLPLVALAAFAVILTAAAVAWVGVAFGGMPLAAAIALGAIVAPPDAAAAAAMLGRFALPRSTVSVLKGESLLNDALALLIFVGAVGAATSHSPFIEQLPVLVLAAPGGLALGIILAKVYLLFAPRLAGTLGGTLAEFVTTFGTWIIAERLHMSAILAVVAYAMTIARYMPERQKARDRIHSYSVWETMVFLTNVLAFLLMGMQARVIVQGFEPPQLWNAVGFAAIVVAVVIVVRIVWVMVYNRARYYAGPIFGDRSKPTLAQSLVVSWCGMRGLITLATALALPADFPARDVIVLSAFAVVLGTLVLQGLTLGPLIRWLDFPADGSLDAEIEKAKGALLDVALQSLRERDDPIAAKLRGQVEAEIASLSQTAEADRRMEVDRLRLAVLRAQRRKLHALRRDGEIDDDVFHTLEQELDWAELAILPQERLEMVES